ncbi:iron-phytosiderophore transporter yellow stripe 1-like [Triticum urartu]|nr:iron-phytosiderophore transporter yellow stripe 1-like [Triticum urartu]
MDVTADRTRVAPEIEKDVDDVAMEGDMESDPALARERQLEPVQPWQEQLTVRGMVAALLIGFIYTVIVMKIALSTKTKIPHVLVVDYKLTYPSGTATAVLINGFHTPKGDKNAKKQVHGFLKYFGISFMWSFFQWFYTGGPVCGFVQFPTFGLKAWKQTFSFDFSLTYVGAGMICSHLVNLSTLLGAVLSWGIMWPLISKQKGVWYPADVPASSMKRLYGYKAFFCVALIIGDGLYQFLKVTYVTSKSLHQRLNKKVVTNKGEENRDGMASPEEIQRDEIFKSDNIPSWMAYTGYAVLSIISSISIPLMFCQIKWYYVIVAYLLAPVLGFSNSYGAGLTDINMAYNYGKIALFIFAAWAGKKNGVIAGLVGGTLVKQLVLMSAELMHDLKTSYLTSTSPRSMLVAQAIGTGMGCIVSPLTFMLFYKAFDVGNPDGYWKAPYALIYRSMAILGVEGFSALPNHCLSISAGIFAFAMLLSIARDILPRRYGKYVPLPMAMAVPFLVGGSFAIDMCIGSLVVFVWEKMNKKEAIIQVPAVASGLICGDGIWVFPSSLLALAKINPPICMKFTPAN